MSTGWEHVEHDRNRARRRASGDDRYRDPILGEILRGNVRRPGDEEGDDDEEADHD